MSDGVLGWLPLVAAVLLVLLWYLSYTAGRLDRLHHRVESTRAALDTQLVRRAAIAVEAAPFLDPATGLILAGAAAEVLARADDVGGGVEVEETENDLTRAICLAYDDVETVGALRADPVAADVLHELAVACDRVQLARRFHNDAVSAAQRVRRKRVVRWARLSGRAAWPRMVEIDDSVPEPLAALR